MNYILLLIVNLYVFTIIPFIQDLPRLNSTPRRDATNGKDGCKGHKKNQDFKDLCIV